MAIRPKSGRGKHRRPLPEPEPTQPNAPALLAAYARQHSPDARFLWAYGYVDRAWRSKSGHVLASTPAEAVRLGKRQILKSDRGVWLTHGWTEAWLADNGVISPARVARLVGLPGWHHVEPAEGGFNTGWRVMYDDGETVRPAGERIWPAPADAHGVAEEANLTLFRAAFAAGTLKSLHPARDEAAVTAEVKRIIRDTAAEDDAA